MWWGVRMRRKSRWTALASPLRAAEGGVGEGRMCEWECSGMVLTGRAGWLAVAASTMGWGECRVDGRTDAR